MIVNGDLATMVAVIEFEILSLVGRKIDLIYLYGTRDFPSPLFSLSLSLSYSVYHKFGWKIFAIDFQFRDNCIRSSLIYS